MISYRYDNMFLAEHSSLDCLQILTSARIQRYVALMQTAAIQWETSLAVVSLDMMAVVLTVLILMSV